MTVDQAIQQTCPRCGSDAAGAPWCPKCGLNLRLHAPDAVPPPPPPTPGTPVRPPSRRRLIALVGGVLVLGGAIAAIAVLALRSPATQNAAATTLIETVVGTQAAAPNAPPVTRAEMRSVLQRYVDAYSAEDIQLLGSLFASDLARKNGTDPIENREAALADYQRQFDGLTNPRYTLVNLDYRAGRGQGVASSPYVIKSASGESRGRITFYFAVRGGRLLIDGIRAVPS